MKQVQIQIPPLLVKLQRRILDMTIGVQEEFVVQVDFVVVRDVVEGVVHDWEQWQMNDHDLHISYILTKYHKFGTQYNGKVLVEQWLRFRLFTEIRQ